MSDEENTPQAPGIAAAWAQPEEPEGGRPPRRRGVGPDPMEQLRNWTPKTRLGRMVQSGQIITIDDALATEFQFVKSRSSMPSSQVLRMTSSMST